MEALAIIFFWCAVLGLIPASIAFKKGKSFMLWWLYGAAIFIVALIHSIVLRSPDDLKSAPPARRTSDAEELMHFAKLRDSGVLTEDEFNAKKREILRGTA